MKIHEYQAKEIFSENGIPVERYVLCKSVEEAVEAYAKMQADKVVVKAQVLTGGRGKAGGVKLASTAKEMYKCATQIWGMNIKGFPVEKIIVSEAVDIAAEYYVSLAVNRNSRSVVLMVSDEGGMDIEKVAKTTPEKLLKFIIDPLVGIPDYLARHFAFLLFPCVEHAVQMASIIQALYKIMLENDASMVEINPLVLTDKAELKAVDAKITFDDNALFRHPSIRRLFEPTEEEKVEMSAKEKGFSYVRMDGKIGCVVNGAGLAMATMDMIRLYGSTPANFLDIGGSSNPQKVVEAMRLLLHDPNVKVVFINIFGGITRCDDVANGLIEAFSEIHTDIPVVVRLTGTNEKAGRDILRKSHRFRVAETMSEAAILAVKSRTTSASFMTN